ncbi:hypothetical protein ILUMI_18305 [Ignelater luminosus]|uniref:Uncharacterized protein n=1 Tax=Ignelater luminosus TaxID=2038154 RepID=A0A8K0CNU9_IGNLU|nr:hypothetical protein ILUMI_18305 [Ignelater luminosus]
MSLKIFPSSNAQASREGYSYSGIPKKEEAIIINTIDEIDHKDYVHAIGEIIDPCNIKFVSRIPYNRIGIFLRNQKLVEELCKHNSIIRINNYDVNIFPLLTYALRLIIFNVCPSVSHNFIEKTLVQRGMQLLSPVTFLKEDFNEENYDHILSYKRQVFVSERYVTSVFRKLANSAFECTIMSKDKTPLLDADLNYMD